MRISDWSSDVCSSDLGRPPERSGGRFLAIARSACAPDRWEVCAHEVGCSVGLARSARCAAGPSAEMRLCAVLTIPTCEKACGKFPSWRRERGSYCSARSEEHTSELQSLMRISYAV